MNLTNLSMFAKLNSEYIFILWDSSSGIELCGFISILEHFCRVRSFFQSPPIVRFQKLNGEYGQSAEQTMEEKIYGGRPDWAKPTSARPGYPAYELKSGNSATTGLVTQQTVSSGSKEPLTKTPIRSDRDLPGKLK